MNKHETWPKCKVSCVIMKQKKICKFVYLHFFFKIKNLITASSSEIKIYFSTHIYDKAKESYLTTPYPSASAACSSSSAVHP